MVINFSFLAIIPDHSHASLVYLYFVIHGIASSLYVSSCWPCIKFMVPKNLTTTAYGLCYCAQNIMLFIGPLGAGIIIDNTEHRSGGYFWSSLFFLVMSILTLIIGIIVFYWDYDNDAILYHGETILGIEENSEANPQ